MSLKLLMESMAAPIEHPRSSEWPKVRAEHLLLESFCQACGTRLHLTVHHILPFHLYRKLELDPKNLITLCETPSSNCHLFFGHKRNWKFYNSNVREVVTFVLKHMWQNNPPPTMDMVLAA